MAQVGGGTGGTRRTLQSSGKMTTQDILNVLGGDNPGSLDSGSIRSYFNLGSGTLTLPNDLYGKSYTDSGNQ